MYEEMADLIRQSREQAGWEQAELAAQLGIGQQAVSGWERGRSRPRRSMLRTVAQLLGLDETRLLEAGRYLSPPAASASQPVRPLTLSLPVDELPPDRFEDFATEILQALHPEGHATRLGGSGEKQFGIDGLVAGSGRNLAAAQYKRRAQFGPAAVSDAVAEATIEADRYYLFLSRNVATRAARQEMTKFSDWELWDGQDISRFVRTALGLERAVRLVETYFPGHRESFLGVPQPSPWLLAEEYFTQASGRIFTHDWELVGRTGDLDRLADAAFGSANAVAVVVGRGGVGKTRLLRAVAEASPGAPAPLWILPSGVPVAASDFELLPSTGSLALILDDAHEREDIVHVITGVRRRNPEANVLLATRPYGWESLSNALTRTGVLPADVVVAKLGDLSLSEAEQLATAALGDAAGGVARRLAQLTLDCPLATVVGGVLIRRGQLSPDQLEGDPSVRDAIMRGFRDALVSDPAVVDPDTRTAVLDAVAALQPLRTNEEAFQRALTELAGKPFDVLNRHLRSLEDAGVLRRRGASLRITPDLLGDVVLAQACFDDRAGIATGFLNRVRETADGQVLQHLLVNASRMDWQVQRRHATQESLVEELWASLEAEVESSDILGREYLAKLVSKIAHFQPRRALKIARWLADHPVEVEAVEEPAASLRFQVTYQSVRCAIPPILKGVAYTLDLLPAAMELLWELAQQDGRPTNQFSEHPVRVLQDLARFEMGKPVQYNAAFVDVAGRWFERAATLSPFLILEPLLATEGSQETFEDFTLRFQPFPLRLDAVSPIRERVIVLAFDEISSADVRRAVAGARALESALRYPHGMYGRPVDSAETDRWTPGFVETIRRLGKASKADHLDPSVLVAIRKTLHWHASYSTTVTRSEASAVVEALPSDVANQVALLVHDGWGQLIRERSDNFQVIQRKADQRLRAAVEALCELPDAEIVSLLSRRLAMERLAFGGEAGHPGPLIAALVSARQTLAPALLTTLATGDLDDLEPQIPVVLATFAEQDSTAALDWARTLLVNAGPERRRAIALAFGWNRSARPLVEGELELLLEAAVDPEPAVRHAAALAAQRLAIHKLEAESIRLVAAIDFSNEQWVAEEVLRCFVWADPDVAWNRLSEAEASCFKARLVSLADIGDYHITAFLAARSAVDPRWVIQLLQDRVTHAEELESWGDYRAMPFAWDNSLKVRSHPGFADHLRELHAWIASGIDSDVRREMGAEVFKEVAGTYDEPVLAVLREALMSHNLQDLRATGSILRKAHRTLIWDSPEFVAAALHAASRFGDEQRGSVAGALWSATVTGGRTGVPGQPFAEDVEQLDRSSEMARNLPAGSVEAAFYRDMATSAQHSIDRSVDEDRDLDGRDW